MKLSDDLKRVERGEGKKEEPKNKTILPPFCLIRKLINLFECAAANKSF